MSLNETLKPITYTSSPLKMLGLLAGSLTFVCIGLFLVISEGTKEGWLAIGFFGLGIPIAIFRMIKPSKLELTLQGFVEHTRRHAKFYNWVDVTEFRVRKISTSGPLGPKFVSFDIYEEEGKALSSIAKTLSGNNAMISDTYGMSAKDLADIMNTYRDNALLKIQS